jgi:hypothetical protein
MHLIIYRWADGSTVSLEPAGTSEYFKFVARTCENGKMSRAGVSLIIRPEVKRLFLSGHSKPVIERIEGPFRAKLLGFMLSLNLGRPRNYSSGLIESDSMRTHLKFPKFVDDQRFSNRYEEAENRTDGNSLNSRTDGKFLGCVEGFRKKKVFYVSGKLVQLSWHHDDLPPKNGARVFKTETEALPLREAVDQLISREDIRPESERTEWIAKNVEFGTWIAPSPEEVEVFHILDELPFFREPNEVREWIESVR